MEFSDVAYVYKDAAHVSDPAYQLLSELKRIIDNEKDLREKYFHLQLRLEKVEKENSKLADENKTLQENIRQYEEQLEVRQTSPHTNSVFTSVSAKEVDVSADVRLNLTGDEGSLNFPVAGSSTLNDSDSSEGHSSVEVNLVDLSSEHFKMQLCGGKPKSHKDMHGMDSIRSKLFNSSVVDRTSDSLVSTADSTTADCNKATQNSNEIEHFDSFETNLNSSLVRTSASSKVDVPSITRRFKQIVEKSPKKKAKTTDEGYSLNSFQEENRHQCPHCSKSYTTKSNLNNHVRSHNMRGEGHECDVCRKVFGNKIHLARHYRMHTGEKPHHCKLCDKRFALLGDLKKHRLSRVHVKKSEKSTLLGFK